MPGFLWSGIVWEQAAQSMLELVVKMKPVGANRTVRAAWQRTRLALFAITSRLSR
jgi:hypothetical protein